MSIGYGGCVTNLNNIICCQILRKPTITAKPIINFKFLARKATNLPIPLIPFKKTGLDINFVISRIASATPSIFSPSNKAVCKKNLTMITIVSLIDTAPMIYTIHSGTVDFNLYHQYNSY